MDYADILRREGQIAHAAFHQFLLAKSSSASNEVFLFFEGIQDPAFYMPHLVYRLTGRKVNTFICHGRAEVLKAYQLVETTKEEASCTMYFVDKDLTDILDDLPPPTPPIFQTKWYSIENYLSCDSGFERYWVERLHLSISDERYADYLNRLRTLSLSFNKRAKTLMALVLLARGIGGHTPTKPNLNNVNLNDILAIDLQKGHCRFKRGACQAFLRACNIHSYSTTAIKTIIRTNLNIRHPKSYIRGKYELWFYATTLTRFAQQLSDRQISTKHGFKRATPAFANGNGILESLAPLTPCPPELNDFLEYLLK